MHSIVHRPRQAKGGAQKRCKKQWNIQKLPCRIVRRGGLRKSSPARPDKPLLRVSVEGGGCSGFQYKFDLVGASEADDLIIERGGARVLIDRMSLEYLAGSEIDFVDDLIGSSFKVINPNATASRAAADQFFRLIAAEVARPAASKRRALRCAAATFSPHLQRLSRRGSRRRARRL